MPQNSKTMRLKEMFRFRSMRRHQEIRKNTKAEYSASTSIHKGEEGKNDMAAKEQSLFPPSVPIVRVQCDPPSEDEGECTRELYRVRSFKRTSKGLISLGDSVRSRSTSNRIQSHLSPVRSTASNSPAAGRTSRASESFINSSKMKPTLTQERKSACYEPGGIQLRSDKSFEEGSFILSGPSRIPSVGSLTSIAVPVKVQILGGPTVGKTMLCRQFLTAEFMGGKTESFSDDSVERFVVIEVDGWNRSLMLIDNVREEAADEVNPLETGVVFFAHSPHEADAPTCRPRSVSSFADYTTEKTDFKPSGQRRKSSFYDFKPEPLPLCPNSQVEVEMRILDVDIYVVVYAVDEEASFKVAKSIFKQLQEIKQSNTKLRLLYLVGNKTDLVRSRQVTTQRGRKFAAANGATFFEVSAAINHLVDELLVDMVVQWRKESAQYDFNRLGLPVHSINLPDSSSGATSGSQGRQSWTSTIGNPKNMLQRIFKQQFTARSCIELQKS